MNKQLSFITTYILITLSSQEIISSEPNTRPVSPVSTIAHNIRPYKPRRVNREAQRYFFPRRHFSPSQANEWTQRRMQEHETETNRKKEQTKKFLEAITAANKQRMYYAPSDSAAIGPNRVTGYLRR